MYQHSRDKKKISNDLDFFPRSKSARLVGYLNSGQKYVNADAGSAFDEGLKIPCDNVDRLGNVVGHRRHRL